MKINNSIAKQLKKDFPIFQNKKNLIYLDSAATTQKPKQVIEKIKEFYENSNANIHRGVYSLSEEATELYEQARKTIAEFINASPEEIIFTRSTTESLNFLSYTISSILPKEKNEIVLTEMEHHSNLVPWQQLAKRENFKLKFIKIKVDFTLDLEDAKRKITDKTAIVSISHISNSLGTINLIEKVIEIAKQKEAITIIDAAQSVPHMKIDVKKIGCDFLAFSGHKVLGPFGIGVLYGKEELLNKLPPFEFGGGMIKKVSLDQSEFANIPEKFEAGTPNVSGVIGLAEAINYLNKIGMKNVEDWEKQLLKYTIEGIKKIDEIEIYNPSSEKSSGILSFNIKKIHPHDIASMLNDYGIAVRAGHHCNMPLMKKLEISGTVRVSFYLYNIFEDIDRLIEGIKKVKEKFN